MLEYDLILLAVAVLVMAFYAGDLYLRLRRHRSPPKEMQWPGHGINATGIAERLGRVRINHALELHARASRNLRLTHLLESVRKSISTLPYIRTRAESSVTTGHETDVAG